VIRVRNRDRVRAELANQGIQTGLHYPIPLHRQQAYAQRAFAKESFPVTEQCAESIVSLPMYAELDAADVRYTAEVLQKILGEIN
jgi:dTDP-4-amino-4,6-dideoxygalactose transaminase